MKYASYASKVFDYFKENQDEELSTDDIIIKFGAPRGQSVYKSLRSPVITGALKKRKDGIHCIYSFGKLVEPARSPNKAKAQLVEPVEVSPPVPAPQESKPATPKAALKTKIESDPQGLSQHHPGAKLDEGKTLSALVLLDFAHALNAVAEVGTKGAIKYSESGWLKVKNGEKRYENAMTRHFLQKGMGESVDICTGQLHQAHIAWNALAVLELMLRRTNDGHKSIITPVARERMHTAK